MKKILLFSAVAGMVTLYSCSKDGKTTTITNTVRDTTNLTVTVFASGKINGDTLANNISLAYSAKVLDSTFPVASADADAPVLDTTYDRTYSVVRSRYLTIYPPNVSGFVAGYYVQIAGAKSYFKVDYPEAAARRAARKANARQSSDNAGTTRGGGEGYIDSTLVFKLPASVRGDTFYIKYAAYDASNRVSKPVTAMVVLLPVGDAATTAALTGSWKYAEYTYNTAGSGDKVFNDWMVDTVTYYKQYYTCDGTTLTATGAETEYYLPYRIYASTWKYQLGNYSMVYINGNSRRNLDLSASTCSNLVYNYSYNNLYSYEGGYSYDAASKKITFITDGYSNLDLSYDSYYLSAVTDSTMILSSSDNNSDNNSTYLYKFFKEK